jgi:hypothetical protein
MKIKFMKYLISTSYNGCCTVIVFLTLTVFFTSCNFTEVDLPSSQLNADDVFEDKNTATAALVEIYSNMRDNGVLTGYPSGTSSQLGLYTDELDFYGIPASGSASFFNNTLLPSTSDVSLFWRYSYNQIYAANAVIEGATNSKSLKQIDKERLIGEALFIRALIHLYLTDLFGDIPYIESTNYQENSKVDRQPVQKIYEHIKDDLMYASSVLSPEYATTERVRPNKWAVNTLLARVLLYMQQWNESSNVASSVINEKSLYNLPTDPSQLFLKGSSSTIWQLMPANTGNPTLEGNLFIFKSGPPPSLALNNTLVNSFSSSDLRKKYWIKQVTTGTNSWYHAYKYKQDTNSGTSSEYSIVLRLSELYLIRSEARLMSGDYIGSKEDINIIRNYAGLGNTNASTDTEILKEILLQRRLELFCEFGHRFFDLKRTQRLDATLGVVKPGWDTHDRLLPLPESELSLNPNLKPQNEGY